MEKQIDWLLKSEEPWTRYRTLVDLLMVPESEPEVISARQEMLNHPHILELIEKAAAWPGYPLKRHNDAKHPLYAISTLADFGVKAGDPGMRLVISRVLEHQSPEGMLETQVLIPKAFGGSDKADWSWMLCDSPTLLYSMLAFNRSDSSDLQPALKHISSLVNDNGWRCTVSPGLGKFKGPGRREDPCPIVNVYVLKVLSVSGDINGESSRMGTDMLLHHWQLRHDKKYFLFGMGTDFAKLKYPFVWFDI